MDCFESLEQQLSLTVVMVVELLTVVTVVMCRNYMILNGDDDNCYRC